MSQQYIELHASLLEHPKMKRLRVATGVSALHLQSHLCALWLWAMEYAPNGDLSRYEPMDIADAAKWEGDPALFIHALINCRVAGGAGFLRMTDKGALIIHNWHQYSGKILVTRFYHAFRGRNRRVPNDYEVYAAGLFPDGMEEVPAGYDNLPPRESNVLSCYSHASQMNYIARLDETKSNQTTLEETTYPQTPIPSTATPSPVVTASGGGGEDAIAGQAKNPRKSFGALKDHPMWQEVNEAIDRNRQEEEAESGEQAGETPSAGSAGKVGLERQGSDAGESNPSRQETPVATDAATSKTNSASDTPSDTSKGGKASPKATFPTFAAYKADVLARHPHFEQALEAACVGVNFTHGRDNYERKLLAKWDGGIDAPTMPTNEEKGISNGNGTNERGTTAVVGRSEAGTRGTGGVESLPQGVLDSISIWEKRGYDRLEKFQRERRERLEREALANLPAQSAAAN